MFKIRHVIAKFIYICVNSVSHCSCFSMRRTFQGNPVLNCTSISTPWAITRSILLIFLEGSMQLLLIPGKRDSAKRITVISRDTSVVNVSFNIGIVSRLLVLRGEHRYQSHTCKNVSPTFFYKINPTHPRDGFVRCVRRQLCAR